jgi:hypothetical protein
MILNAWNSSISPTLSLSIGSVLAQPLGLLANPSVLPGPLLMEMQIDLQRTGNAQGVPINILVSKQVHGVSLFDFHLTP